MRWLKERLRKLLDTTIVVRVTNLGLGFVLLTLVVAIGATNTGNNGLYVLLSTFLGALVVSGVVSRRNVERLVPELDGPDDIHAGEPVRFTLKLRNDRKRTRRAVLVRIAGASQPLLFPLVPPESTQSRGIDLVFSRRGRRKVESLLVYSAYPIGLFRKGRVHADARERIVFPRILRRPLPRPEARGPAGERTSALKRGRGADVRLLREALPWDDPRDLHWPQTARQGTLITKERSAEEGHDSVVALALARPPLAGPAWDAAFEEAVSEAAGAVLQLLSRGDRVGLLLGDRLLSPGVGPVQRRALLAALALVEAREGTDPSRPRLPAGLLVYPVAARLEREAA